MEGAEAERGLKLLTQKYFLKRIFDLFAVFRQTKRDVLVITRRRWLSDCLFFGARDAQGDAVFEWRRCQDFVAGRVKEILRIYRWRLFLC